WLLRPLPANAAVDDKLNERIDGLCARLPGSIGELDEILLGVRMYVDYDAAVNQACACVWEVLDQFYTSGEEHRLALLTFAEHHMVEQAQARILRRLVKDPVTTVRSKARQRLKRSKIKEVALPLEPEGDWGPAGWLKGAQPASLSRHKQGRRVQAAQGLP